MKASQSRSSVGAVNRARECVDDRENETLGYAIDRARENPIRARKKQSAHATGIRNEHRTGAETQLGTTPFRNSNIVEQHTQVC